ncbi:MAG: hypothetical protein RSD57_15920 [Comamonas sp.]
MIDWDQMKTAEQLADEARRASVPAEISRAQGKGILIQRGLMPAVQTYIAAIADPEEAMWADLAMNDATVWRRYDSPFLLQAAAALGLTDEQLDEMFIAGSQIVI